MARIVTCSRGHRRELADREVPSSGELDAPCPECSGWYLTPPPGDSPTSGHDLFRQLDPPTEGLPSVPGYELLSVLGRGGMGVVYRARQLALDRVVAVKMLRPGADVPDEVLRRFRTEAESTAGLQHPNVVRVYEVGEAGGRPYLVMEWVNGGTLAARLGRTPLLPRAAAAVVGVLARATDYAHKRGVVHRDLKPANVLLELAADAAPDVDLELGLRLGVVTPKVSDFGLAKRLGHDDQTHTSTVLGTPSYMAPEQAAGGSRDVGPAADIYALGAILYETLTGRPPFRAATALETLDLVRHADPIPPARFQPRLPRDLQTICLKCLEKSPARRYASAADLAADLDRFGHGLPVRARPVGVVGRAVRWTKRRPTAAALVGVCLVGAAAGVGGLVAHNASLRAEVERTRLQEAETARQKTTALDHVRRGHEALDDIFMSLENAPVGMSGNVTFQAMREEQAQAILRYYRDTLRQGDDADPELRFHRGLVSVYAGRMQLRLRNWAAAEPDLRRGSELLAPLAAAHAAPVPHRQEWAQCCYWMGVLRHSAGRYEDADQYYLRAAATAGALEADGVAGERDRRVSALSHTRLAEIHFYRNRPASAERHALEAVGRWDQLIDADPGNEVHRLWAMTALHYLAFTYLQSQKWAEFDPLIRRAAVALEWYTGHPPRRVAGLAGRIELGKVIRCHAHSLSARGETRAALDRLTEAIRLAETVLHVEPASESYRGWTALMYRDRAFFRSPVAESWPDWDRAVSLSDGGLALGYRIERASARLDAGDGDEAVGELDAVAANDSLDGDRAKALGRAFARAAGAVQDQKRDELAAKAVAAVRRAVETGGFPSRDSFRQFVSDPAFAAVRPRAEFDELEQRIEEKPVK